MGFSRIVWLATMVVASRGFGQSGPPQLSAGAAARFLDQATWGPTPASIAELQQLGINNWLQAQFALNLSDIQDQPILNSGGKPNHNIHPVQAAFFKNAATGQDQLRQRVAFALSQIWVVSYTGVPFAYAFPPYWRIFRDNGFGNYRDIIRAVTLNPAMGRYLNMANNNKANPAKNNSPNENYARELMQLFTLGLAELNPDGTRVLDENKNPIPTYNQTVVTNLAKVLTGWTYPTAPGAKARTNNPEHFFGEMFAVESEHDTSAKTIFGNITLPAGQTAEQDLDSLLDALMAQPTMAPFVSEQLIQHLVTSNPSPQYIARVSSVFQNDGTGIAGNLQAVIAAILTDPEARAGDDPSATTANPAFGHLREPVLLMANLLRGLNATLTASSAINSQSAELGEDLFNPPSVFSYFSPQYRIPGGLLGPEFQIYTTQTAADRADIISSILYGRIDKGTTVDLTPFVQQAGSSGSLLSAMNSAFLHGSMSAVLEQAATDAIHAASTPVAKTQAALYVVLTSDEYQIIH
jgi:uncharacterized protein (DUF1800 family)